ncbi:hypothetical protein HanXRQr2_Chr10g0461821 [Helianthus annuus]|uniref:Uncharacterized protein n=1 Tax=Helianthus annuus TaxID=4232 RepID=A0A9K3N650_HELAN|nr:hypothetical protein HanXRQr2_Chr10g0461821 [Helianthus annuus]
MAEQPCPVREFHRNHNQIVLLNENVHGATEYSDIIRFLRNSRIGFAISENIHQVQSYIEDFWRTAQIVDDSIEATIHGSPIVIMEAVIRAALRFGDLDYGNMCYVRQIRERGVRSFGYVGSFTWKEIYKGLIIGQWRYFFHVLMQCLSARKSGTDTMGHDLLSAMIGLTYNQPYNFSLMILQAYKHQIGLKANDKRLMILYPRFLSLIIRHLLPNLSFDASLPAYAQAPMPIRIFTDCARVNESKRTDARPVTTPLRGAIIQGNYNSENDPNWLNIRSGVDQIFVGVSTSSATGVAVETDEVILELDAALDAGPSSRTADKGKRPMEEVFVDDMLTEKEYLFSSSSDDDEEDRRRPDTDSVCVPVPLKTYKRRRVTVSDLQSSSPIVSSVTVTSSSASSDSRGLLNLELSVALPSLSSSLPFTSFVEATSMVTSIQLVTPMMSSPIPAVPLFELLSSQMGTGNVFALSGSSSLPPRPSAFTDLQAPETRQARPKVAFGPSPPV